MLASFSQEEDQQLVAKLRAVAEIYRATINDPQIKPVKKQFYERLVEVTEFIADNYIETKEFQNENCPEGSPISWKFAQRFPETRKDFFCSAILASLAFFTEDYIGKDLLNLNNNLLAENNALEVLRWQIGSNASLRSGKESDEDAIEYAKQLIENVDPLYFEEQYKEFFDQVSQDLIQQEANALASLFLQDQIQAERANFRDLFDSQKPHNYAQVICKHIKCALPYASNTTEKKYLGSLIKELQGYMQGLQEGIAGYHSLQGALRDHIGFTIELGQQTLKEAACQQITELCNRFPPEQKERALNMIAFYACKELDKKFGLAKLEISEPIDAVEGDLRSILHEMQKTIDKHQQANNSFVKKFMLSAEELLLTIWHAIEYYIVMNRGEKQDVDAVRGWSQFLVRKKSEVAVPGPAQ